MDIYICVYIQIYSNPHGSCSCVLRTHNASAERFRIRMFECLNLNRAERATRTHRLASARSALLPRPDNNPTTNQANRWAALVTGEAGHSTKSPTTPEPLAEIPEPLRGHGIRDALAWLLLAHLPPHDTISQARSLWEVGRGVEGLGHRARRRGEAEGQPPCWVRTYI